MQIPSIHLSETGSAERPRGPCVADWSFNEDRVRTYAAVNTVQQRPTRRRTVEWSYDCLYTLRTFGLTYIRRVQLARPYSFS